jgi:4-methylaminobutanoate oxidase (formaldehyde-forming)
MQQADIVIIGGGIWGLSTAFHLASKAPGMSIVVLERNASFAHETTGQAAGQIGQLRSDPLMARAVQYSLSLLSGFRDQTGHDPMFVRSGSLHLAQVDERMESFRLQLAHARKLGIEVEQADGPLISRIAPTVNQREIVGALYVPGDGYVEAPQCALAYGNAAADLGAQLRSNTAIEKLVVRSGQVVAVETSQGTIETACVIVAAGPWTSSLAASLGVQLPVQAIRLERARTAADPRQPPKHPTLRIPDQNGYLRPQHGGYSFGYFDSEPEAIDVDGSRTTTADILPDKHRMEQFRQRLSRLLPVLDELPIEQYNQGMVTCSPDASYVLGPMPGVAGVWLATGCSAMGIAGSAAVGKWLANWVIDGDPGDDLTAFAPDRFGARVNDRRWVREQSCRICARYYALDSVTYHLA